MSSTNIEKNLNILAPAPAPASCTGQPIVLSIMSSTNTPLLPPMYSKCRPWLCGDVAANVGHHL